MNGAGWPVPMVLDLWVSEEEFPPTQSEQARLPRTKRSERVRLPLGLVSVESMRATSVVLGHGAASVPLTRV